MAISDNLKRIEEKIELCAQKSGRKREDITLCAVTKKVTEKEAIETLSLGVKNLAENRVQSLCEKYDVLKDAADWHLIGHLQTNKVKYIADKVKLIHSVESIKLLDEINLRAKKADRILDVLLEVNVSGEESKFGIRPDEIWEYLEKMAEYENVRLKGLMTIAPIPQKQGDNRKYFYELNKLFIDIKEKKYDNVSMEFLSMGMSLDFEDAILEGANIVRIGTALFA
ncbi:MAG: YggS family pyridoxal phosphate-dependent enzyme [Clostridia bacterium]|nr:YggS family pyridoxal phosphate-dependent enzyme [Clostridia bacterium]